MFFFLYTLLLVYLFTIPWLSASPGSSSGRSNLYNVRNTSPSAALQCKPVVLLYSSHSFIFSLLKSRSPLLFINCCFTTLLVFPLLLTKLLQCRTSFYNFWCGESLKEASRIKKISRIKLYYLTEKW